MVRSTVDYYAFTVKTRKRIQIFLATFWMSGADTVS